MNAYEKMAVQLKSTKLYRMDGTGLVDAEMKAYGKALDFMWAKAKRILTNCFFDQEDNTQRTIYESLFGLPKTGELDSEEKRELARRKSAMMKQRLSIRNTDFNKAGIQKAIASGGMTVMLTENFGQKSIAVTVVKDENMILRQEDKEAFIRGFLPCHSTAEIVFPDSSAESSVTNRRTDE